MSPFPTRLGRARPWLSHAYHTEAPRTRLSSCYDAICHQLIRPVLSTFSHLVQVKRQRDTGPAEKHQIDPDEKTDRPQA